MVLYVWYGGPGWGGFNPTFAGSESCLFVVWRLSSRGVGSGWGVGVACGWSRLW